MFLNTLLIKKCFLVKFLKFSMPKGNYNSSNIQNIRNQIIVFFTHD